MVIPLGTNARCTVSVVSDVGLARVIGPPQKTHTPEMRAHKNLLRLKRLRRVGQIGDATALSSITQMARHFKNSAGRFNQTK